MYTYVLLLHGCHVFEALQERIGDFVDVAAGIIVDPAEAQ